MTNFCDEKIFFFTKLFIFHKVPKELSLLTKSGRITPKTRKVTAENVKLQVKIRQFSRFFFQNDHFVLFCVTT